MIKLIATDLDGTLVNSDKNVPQENIEALHYAHNKGVKIVVCTGRPFKATEPVLDAINLKSDNDYFITFNGAQVQKSSNYELMVQNGLSLEDLKIWYEELNRLDLPLNVVDDEWVYEPLKYKEGFESFYVEKITSAPAKRVDFDTYFSNEKFLKFVCTINEEHLSSQMAKIDQEFYNKYAIVKSHPFQMEIGKKGVSKGAALLQLGEQLNIKPEEMMTLGDQENDRSMIEMAGIGVAMGNATEEIKKIADYITETNNNNGVAKAIYHYIR